MIAAPPASDREGQPDYCGCCMLEEPDYDAQGRCLCADGTCPNCCCTCSPYNSVNWYEHSYCPAHG